MKDAECTSDLGCLILVLYYPSELPSSDGPLWNKTNHLFDYDACL